MNLKLLKLQFYKYYVQIKKKKIRTEHFENN
jgi:hypothetical protein